jgi:hypothetical protein
VPEERKLSSVLDAKKQKLFGKNSRTYIYKENFYQTIDIYIIIEMHYKNMSDFIRMLLGSIQESNFIVKIKHLKQRYDSDLCFLDLFIELNISAPSSKKNIPVQKHSFVKLLSSK